jgi:hypothetical protein
MSLNHVDDYEEDDALLNASLSEAETDNMPLDDDELRLARIAEYLHEALRKDDPLRANLGAFNAGLMEIALKHEAAVKNSLNAAAGNILENPHLQRGLSVHANLLRQMDRNVNLDIRLDVQTRVCLCELSTTLSGNCVACRGSLNEKISRHFPATPTF